MASETKMERLERENRDLRDEVESVRAWAKREATEARRLSARCTFLYEQAADLGAELVAMRLRSPREVSE